MHTSYTNYMFVCVKMETRCTNRNHDSYMLNMTVCNHEIHLIENSHHVVFNLK